MRYDFDEVLDRRGTESVKWHEYPEDVLPMWVADMDFRSPPPVIKALRRRVEFGVFGYPEGLHGTANELPGFRQLIVDRMAERHRWQVRPEDLVFIPGVIAGFNKACLAAAAPGGAVLVQPPIYPPILEAARNTGMIRQDAPLARLSDGSFAIDEEAFAAAITPETRLFILCNPHNPVGRVFRREELERMAEVCLRHGITICSDEIHSDLVFRGQHHVPVASLDPEIAQHTITLIAPSKTYNLPGLQCAIAIVQNPELRERYRRAGQGLVSWVNLMGLVAAQAAYRDGQEWLDQLLPYLEANRDYLYNYVGRELSGITMPRPEGTYLAWLDCRNAGIEGNPFVFFLKKARVALSDGATFGAGGEGFVRLSFGCPRALLVEGLERMRRALRPSAG